MVNACGASQLRRNRWGEISNGFQCAPFSLACDVAMKRPQPNTKKTVFGTETFAGYICVYRLTIAVREKDETQKACARCCASLLPPSSLPKVYKLYCCVSVGLPFFWLARCTSTNKNKVSLSTTTTKSPNDLSN